MLQCGRNDTFSACLGAKTRIKISVMRVAKGPMWERRWHLSCRRHCGLKEYRMTWFVFLSPRQRSHVIVPVQRRYVVSPAWLVAHVNNFSLIFHSKRRKKIIFLINSQKIRKISHLTYENHQITTNIPRENFQFLQKQQTLSLTRNLQSPFKSSSEEKRHFRYYFICCTWNHMLNACTTFKDIP